MLRLMLKFNEKLMKLYLKYIYFFFDFLLLCRQRQHFIVMAFEVHGHSVTPSAAAVNFICDHPAIKAISFVGSNQAGEYIYERGSKNGKRVQSNMVSIKGFNTGLIPVKVQKVAALFNRFLYF